MDGIMGLKEDFFALPHRRSEGIRQVIQVFEKRLAELEDNREGICYLNRTVALLAR